MFNDTCGKQTELTLAAFLTLTVEILRHGNIDECDTATLQSVTEPVQVHRSTSVYIKADSETDESSTSIAGKQPCEQSDLELCHEPNIPLHITSTQDPPPESSPLLSCQKSIIHNLPFLLSVLRDSNSIFIWKKLFDILLKVVDSETSLLASIAMRQLQQLLPEILSTPAFRNIISLWMTQFGNVLISTKCCSLQIAITSSEQTHDGGLLSVIARKAILLFLKYTAATMKETHTCMLSVFGMSRVGSLSSIVIIVYTLYTFEKFLSHKVGVVAHETICSLSHSHTTPSRDVVWARDKFVASITGHTHLICGCSSLAWEEY